MKICIVSHFLDPVEGGGAVSTQTFIKAFKELGHEITHVKTPHEIKKGFDVILHQNIQNLIKTQRICERLNMPLVVTINSNITCPTGAHVTNETKYGVPCLNCSFFRSFTCHLWNKRNKGYTKSQRVLSVFQSLPKYILRNLRIKALNRANKVICVSPSLKERLVNAGVDREKTEVIIQPVDSFFFIDPKVRLFDERVALFAGAASWIKGAHLAAEAVSKLNDIKLLFVGGVGGKMRSIIKDFLGERAIFIGRVPYKDMRKYYYSAHVTLFSSIWFDPHGRVWTESCACGTPVVAFNDRGGASDFLVHEETALLSNYDVDEYASQINRLLEDEELHRKISRNAQEYVKKNFLAEVVAKKYEKVFEEVLERD